MLKKVEKGQKFKPSANFHNKVVDAVNAMDGFKSIGQSKGQSNDIRISFINTLEEEIPTGAPIVVESYDAKNDIFKVRKFKVGDPVYGVNKLAVQKGKSGSAVMFGIAEISVSGEAKKFVAPVPEKFEWQYSDVGISVLCPCTDGVIVLVGCSGSSLAKLKEDRPFFATYNPKTNMVDITGGNLLANGEAIVVKGDSVGVMDGLICVTAENKNGSYVNATFKYGEFAPNCIPIAAVKVEKTEGVVTAISIVNFYVSTAVIIETDPHPPCTCVGGGV